MRTILNMLAALKRIDLRILCVDSMDETGNDYADLQKDQMYAGIKSDDSAMDRIGEFYHGYAPLTKVIKAKKGQKISNVTLRDTGAFYNGIYTSRKADGLFINSRDPKTDKLEQDYGTAIWGLGTEYGNEYVDILQPVVIDNMIDKINYGADLSVTSSVLV